MSMYTLRQATEADYEFLYRLHKAAMQPYIEATWGWQEEWQQEYFARKWNPQARQIIQIQGQDAGVLVIEIRQGEHYLALIELLPECQGHGVGTAVLADFLHEAETHSLPATLHVLKTNGRARQFYERLGFAIVADEEIRYKMQREKKTVNGER
ncbi:MAG: GNAT family N-acetyltransferase [Anaerolineales bacterium]|nr:GNAT family N-acetyltransferase [Anaerolineales bacterium]